jgi:1,4-dihydroxy-2-naphthoate octaprenyltransferase
MRDVGTDAVSGKRTLAVRLGDRTTRWLFVACYAGSFAAVVAIGVTQPWGLLGLLALPLAIEPARLVLTRSDPPSLVAALVATARLEVVVAVLVSIGLCLS